MRRKGRKEGRRKEKGQGRRKGKGERRKGKGETDKAKILINTPLHSLAVAFAKSVFPVPGGPKKIYIN